MNNDEKRIRDHAFDEVINLIREYEYSFRSAQQDEESVGSEDMAMAYRLCSGQFRQVAEKLQKIKNKEPK